MDDVHNSVDINHHFLLSDHSGRGQRVQSLKGPVCRISWHLVEQILAEIEFNINKYVSV